MSIMALGVTGRCRWRPALLVLLLSSTLCAIVCALPKQQQQCVINTPFQLKLEYKVERGMALSKLCSRYSEMAQKYEQQKQLEQKRKEQQERYRKQQEERKKQQEQKRKEQEQKRKKQQQERQNKNRTPPRKQDPKKNPYAILGVGMDATHAEIKQAYRKLSLKYHPDKNPEDREAAREKFADLVEAYEILGDEDERSKYHDETFGAYQSRPHNYNAKTGFYSQHSLITPLNMTEFERLALCHGPFYVDEDGEEETCVPWMVEFYASWCVHCKDMIPEWKRAASQMDGSETPLGFVRFGAVNCETERALCQKQAIRSYPKIRLFARDAMGQDHVEEFPTRGKPRNAESFIEFAEKGIRLAHEATLRPVDAYTMDMKVLDSNATGLWVIMYENGRDRHCPHCGPLKSSLRRMSANIASLSNFGVVDCGTEKKVCDQQHIGNQFPVLKMYPYKGAKGTGETLISPGGADPLVLLPVMEKVIRMCLQEIEAETGLMNMLHEEEYIEEEERQQCTKQWNYPEPEREQTRVLPAGVRARTSGFHISSN